MRAPSSALPHHDQLCGAVRVIAFLHPLGCRSYLLADPVSRQALALDPHLDALADLSAFVRAREWTLPYVVETHTHADHPSGAAELAASFGSTRIAHPRAEHRGVTRHPADGETLHLGDVPVRVRHAPGHTPDHLVLLVDGALFSGDSLFIGSVARTDFLGGDAGRLYDTLESLLADVPDATLLFPGHDYADRVSSTLGQERAENPWLQIRDRAEFVRRLAANPPPKPANMDELIALNRDGWPVVDTMGPAPAVARVRAGGAASVIDVRSGVEWDVEHIPGSRHVPLDELNARLDEIRRTPAPRLLLCRTGRRSRTARESLAAAGVGALQVVEGGLEAYRAAGGETAGGRVRITLERQVRVASGSLALLGSMLGFFVHPAFLLVPAFVGAGSVFAGLTDWCGMGLLLARMPWNRRSGDTATDRDGTCAASATCAAGGSGE